MLQEDPTTYHNAQLKAIEHLRDAFRRWAPPPTAPTAPHLLPTPFPTLRRTRNQRRPASAPIAPPTPTPTPRVAPRPARTPPAPVPRVVPVRGAPSAPGAAGPVPEPVAHHTRSQPDGAQLPRVDDTEPIVTWTRSPLRPPRQRPRICCQHLFRLYGGRVTKGAPLQHLLRLRPLHQLQGWRRGQQGPHRRQFQGWYQFEGRLLRQGPPDQYQSLSPTTPGRSQTARNFQGWTTRNPS